MRGDSTAFLDIGIDDRCLKTSLDQTAMLVHRRAGTKAEKNQRRLLFSPRLVQQHIDIHQPRPHLLRNDRFSVADGRLFNSTRRKCFSTVNHFLSEGFHLLIIPRKRGESITVGEIIVKVVKLSRSTVRLEIGIIDGVIDRDDARVAGDRSVMFLRVNLCNDETRKLPESSSF